MGSHTVDAARLMLLVDRLLDAELLPAEEGAAMQQQADTARRSLAMGDEGAARIQYEQFTRFTEALISRDALDAADGRAIVETARRIVGRNDD